MADDKKVQVAGGSSDADVAALVEKTLKEKYDKAMASYPAGVDAKEVGFLVASYNPKTKKVECGWISDPEPDRQLLASVEGEELTTDHIEWHVKNVWRNLTNHMWMRSPMGYQLKALKKHVYEGKGRIHKAK